MLDFIVLFFKLFGSIIILLFLFRMMGNKELAQSTPMDFVYMVLMISIAWDTSLEPKYNILETILLMIGVSIVIYTIDVLTSKYPRIERTVVGKPKILICNGKINELLLKEERMSKNELLTKLRLKDVFDVEEVEICYLEFSGEISVKKKGEK